MNPSLLSILQDQFLNKYITVPVPERDNYGRTIPNKTVDIAGQCTFIGENKIMGWEIQVTVDLMPIQIKHINNIRLRPDR